MDNSPIGQIVQYNGSLVLVQQLDFDTIKFWENEKNWKAPLAGTPKQIVKDEVMSFWECSKNQRLIWKRRD